MPQQRDPFQWEVSDIVRGTQDLVLRTEPWPFRDQVLYCDMISVSNAHGSGGDVEVGLFQGGHHFPLDTIFNLVAGMWHYGHGKFTFLSKWQIYARFFYETDGEPGPCENGHQCDLHVIGYVLEPYTSP